VALAIDIHYPLDHISLTGYNLHMYTQFYGLKEKPFNVTSDPNFLFLSRTHKEALSHLLYGIKEKKGFIAITGEIGAGKTTLCKALLNQLGNDVKTAFVFNPNLSGLQLLETMLEDLGITPQKRNKMILFKQLNEFLLEELRASHNVVLIIDEAQGLKNSLLEELRMLSNLETPKEKLFQIILVGQPQLTKKLNSPTLVQLRQRIAIRFHLSPLSKDEVKQYIDHRLYVAGSTGDIILTDDALDVLFPYTGGIPRLINLVCDRALLHGYAKGTRILDEKIIRTCVTEIDGITVERAAVTL